PALAPAGKAGTIIDQRHRGRAETGRSRLVDFLLAGLSTFYTLLGGALVFWIISRQRNQKLEVWREAAASCGLQVVEMGPPLRARTGPLEVRFDGSGSRGQDTQLAVVVPGPPDFHKVRI